MSLVVSGTFLINNLVRKTRAQMFSKLNVGDKIRIECVVKSLGTSSHGGSYAGSLKITNLTNAESVHKSFNELANILDAFDLEPVGGNSESSTRWFDSEVKETEDVLRHQRDLLLDLIHHILVRSGFVSRETKVTNPELYANGAKYLDTLK